MAETTHISWCDHTFNPWIGCQKVSPACDGCYAEHLMANRHKRVTWGKPGQKPTYSRTSEGNWREPLKWNRKAAEAGTRPFVFCASLADVFDNNVEPEWRADLLDLIDRTPHLVWLLLTKRPQNIVEMVQAAGGMPPHARNIAFGTTIEDQTRADLNVPHLCEAKVELNPLFTFVSCEPLLGEIHLRSIRVKPGRFSFMRPTNDHFDALHPHAPWKIDWIITGGETDQGKHEARPTHPDAYRILRDQAAGAGSIFHHKQNGEWLGGDQIPEPGPIPSGVWSDAGLVRADDNSRVWLVGKKFSGRLLDGVLHDARPEVPAL